MLRGTPTAPDRGGGTEDAVAGGQGGGVELKMLETGQGTTCARVVHTRHAQQPALYLERSYSPTGGVKDTCPQSPPQMFYLDRSLMVVTCAFSWFRWRFFSYLLTIGPLKAPPTLGRDQRSSSHSLSCAKLGVSSFGALAHLFAARGISRHCCRRLEKRAV